MYKIPLSTPTLNGNESKYVQKCIDTEWVSSAGEFVTKFENKVAEYVKSTHAIACVNGTSALQVSLKLIGLGLDDEVIVPSLTFIAPVNAISYNGGKPLFIDSDSHYNIDIEKTIDFIKNYTFTKGGKTYNKITKNKIAAIIPVHVWGNAVWLDDLFKICMEKNIKIIEDASESLGTYYTKGKFKSKHTGTIGELGCISFNGNKIVTAGGGGIILTNSDSLANKARYLTTQAKDDPVKYVHNEIGYNFRLTNIQAAIGLAQMEQLPNFLKIKKIIYKNYKKNIKNIEGIKLANAPSFSNNNHWMNVLKLDSFKYKYNRDELMKKLSLSGIQTRPVWAPIHQQKPYLNCQSFRIENTNSLIKNSLCLPSSTNLSSIDIQKVLRQL